MEQQCWLYSSIVAYFLIGYLALRRLVRAWSREGERIDKAVDGALVVVCVLGLIAIASILLGKYLTDTSLAPDNGTLNHIRKGISVENGIVLMRDSVLRREGILVPMETNLCIICNFSEIFALLVGLVGCFVGLRRCFRGKHGYKLLLSGFILLVLGLSMPGIVNRWDDVCFPSRHCGF
jgi:hypothetical protein